MSEILVLANETIGGKALLDAIRERAAEGDAHFHVVVPLQRPKHGNVIYAESRRGFAQVRVDLALNFMGEEGIDGQGEVGDQDPFNAAMDAVAEHGIDEIIVSTLPATESAWLRRDLIAKLESETGLPVRHIVVDLNKDGLPFEVTLVLANQTAAGEALIERLEELDAEGPHRFIVVVPQDIAHPDAVQAAKRRLNALLDSLHKSHIVAAGTIGDPDPYTAAMNCMHFFRITQVVISTLPRDRSKWLAEGLPEKVEKGGGKPVEHIEMAAEAAPAEA